MSFELLIIIFELLIIIWNRIAFILGSICRLPQRIQDFPLIAMVFPDKATKVIIIIASGKGKGLGEGHHVVLNIYAIGKLLWCFGAVWVQINICFRPKAK